MSPTAPALRRDCQVSRDITPYSSAFGLLGQIDRAQQGDIQLCDHGQHRFHGLAWNQRVAKLLRGCEHRRRHVIAPRVQRARHHRRVVIGVDGRALGEAATQQHDPAAFAGTAYDALLAAMLMVPPQVIPSVPACGRCSEM